MTVPPTQRAHAATRGQDLQYEIPTDAGRQDARPVDSGRPPDLGFSRTARSPIEARSRRFDDGERHGGVASSRRDRGHRFHFEIRANQQVSEKVHRSLKPASHDQCNVV